MKLSQQQLRRIVREAVKYKLEGLNEAPEGTIDIPGEIAEFVTEAVITGLMDERDGWASNAWEQMLGTLGEDNIPVPSRIEDIDPYAEQAAAKVMLDPRIKEQVTVICKLLLESAMDDFGSPGPGTR